MKLGFTTGTQILKKNPYPGSTLSRNQPSTGKVIAKGVLDHNGIILIDYKPAGTSITGEYYANAINPLRVVIEETRREKVAPGVLLLHMQGQSCTNGYS